MIKGMRITPKLIALLRSEKTAFALTIILGALGGISAVIFAWLMSQTIGKVFLDGRGLGDVTRLLIALVIISGMRALAQFGSEAAASLLAAGIKSRLRVRLIEHLFALGPAYLRGERGERDVRTGELANSLTEGVEAMDAYFRQYLPQIVLAALIPLSVLIFIFPMDPLSGFVLLLTAPLIPLFMILIGSNSEARTRRQWLSLSRMSATILDIMQGLTTLKLLGRSKEQIQTIRQMSERLRGTTMDVLRVTFLAALALELVTTISTAVVAVQVGLRLLYGYLDFQEAFFVLLLAPEFYLPLRLLGTRFHAGMNGIAAAQRIFEILEVERETGSPLAEAQEDNRAISLPGVLNKKINLCRNIHFKNVSVRYSDGRVALEQASFEIKAGGRTALVGASGAGKSTIAGLLLRFLKPEGGEIWVDDNLLKSIPTGEWRHHIAWVAQDSYLFNDSVEANISLGCPQASLEEVVQAAKMASAHEFIQSLPDGYATRVGERGTRMSAGQAQRIALARAFLKDVPILILDEPSAHLDPETEMEIQKALEQLMQGRTTLVIAHRLKTILQSDRIILLVEGRVEATGSHQELLARSGIYREMVDQNRADSPDTLRELNEEISPILPDQSETIDATGIWNTIQEGERVPDQQINPYSILKRLGNFLAPYKWRVALSVLLGWATISSGIGLMVTSAFIIAKAALHPAIAELQVAIVGVRFFGLSRGLFRYAERLVSHDVTLRILSSLREWLYRAIEPLVPARISSYRSGDLLKRMTGDISSLENLYVRGLAPALVALLVAGTSAFFISRFAISLAILLLPWMILAGTALPWIVRRLGRQAGGEIIRSQGEMSAAIVDGLQGMPELLVFGASDRYEEHVDEIQQKLSKAQARLGWIDSGQTAMLGLLGNFATLTVLSAAISLVQIGKLDGLFLGVIALAVLTSFEALQPLPQAAQVLEGNLQSASRLFAIADAPPVIKEPISPRPLSDRWDLAVCGLSFSYPVEGDVPVDQALQGISFELPNGKHLAVVGSSGAGKSTLVRLLARLWDYQAGSILLNGYELDEYSGDDLRKNIAVVPQSPYLFTATILDNLRIARPQASMDEIVQAARRAYIHDFIAELPQGYQTWVGEHGLRLSAGERQRIAVARALLKDVPLLILDEATAYLDVLNEQALLASIRKARQGSSLLMVTHRLVGMDGFDEILVLDRGRVVERGRHAELLAARGLYWQLWQAQLGF